MERQVRHVATSLVKVRWVKAWQDRLGPVALGAEWHGLVLHGVGRHGKVRPCVACWAEVRQALVWYGRQGEFLFGSVGPVGEWLCADGFGLAGMAWNHRLQMKER